MSHKSSVYKTLIFINYILLRKIIGDFMEKGLENYSKKWLNCIRYKVNTKVLFLKSI